MVVKANELQHLKVNSRLMMDDPRRMGMVATLISSIYLAMATTQNLMQGLSVTKYLSSLGDHPYPLKIDCM